MRHEKRSECAIATFNKNPEQNKNKKNNKTKPEKLVQND